MRCPSCQYALWNIEARRCPECGTGFAPSQFRFQPDAVKFCCPHCRQAYYGTDDAGLLTPRAFTCVGCRKPVELDQMILAPAEGVDEDDTLGPTVRWLERPVVGFWTALFGTLFDALFRPARLGRALPAGSRLGPAIGFAALTATAFGIMGLWLIVLVIALGAGPARLVLGNNPANPWPLLLFIPVGMALAVLFMAVVVAAWSGVTHLMLRLTGPVARPFSVTVQSLCYGHGANVLAGIPCAGMNLSLLSWVWWAISSAAILTGAQRVSGSRATIAVFTAPLVVIAAIAAGVFGWLIPAVQSIPGNMLSNPTLAAAYGDSRDLQQALVKSYADNQRWPDHAARLILDGHARPGAFWTELPRNGLRVGAVDLWGFHRLSAQEQATIRAGAEPVLAAEAPGLIAHRVGDVVFTYHGVPTLADGGDPSLWLLVHLAPGLQPLPAAAAGSATGATATGTVTVTNTPVGPMTVSTGTATDKAAPPVEPAVVIRTLGGAPVIIKRAEFARALKVQNEMRVKAGLVPLDDPLALTAEQPQRAAPAAAPAEPGPPPAPGG